MDEERVKRVERIVRLTEEFIYLLTGEECTIVKKGSGDHVTFSSQSHVSEEWSGGQGTVMVPLPERNNDKKILEVINKIIELLTEEVPLRCQDVAVYFSMEEWDFLEGHKDFCKDNIIEEDRQLLTSLDKRKNEAQSANVPPNGDNKVEDILFPPLQGELQLILPCEPPTLDLLTNGGHLPDHGPDAPNAMGPSMGKAVCSNLGELFTKREEATCSSEGRSSSRPNDHKTLPSPSELRRPEGNPRSYFCSKCGKSFIHKSKLLAHKRYHTNQRLYSCSKCEQSFKHKRNRDRHEKLHTEKKAFSCPVCGKAFSRQSNLFQHKELHTRGKLFWCSVCGKFFSQQADLFQHETVHAEVKPHQCPKCGKHFSKTSDLVKHQAVHTGEKAFSCPKCSKCFSYRSSLTRHIRVHTVKVKGQMCNQCGKSFSSKMELRKHKAVHQKQAWHLIQHEKLHREKKSHPCPICGKSFTCNNSLSLHKEVHDREKLLCGRGFSQQADPATVHAEVKPHECPECGKHFPYKSDLMKHRVVHTGEKAFSCSECGKCFSHSYSLTRHERSHMVEIPDYICNQCGRSFSRRSDLTNHKVVHMKKQPYSCSECGQCFRRKPDLEEHIAVHTRGLYSDRFTHRRVHKVGEDVLVLQIQENISLEVPSTQT